VLLIGGAAGTGKTSVSYRIAQHFGVGITEVDDFQVLLEAMTTPEQQPALHYWRTHPEAALLPAESIVELTINAGEAMRPGLEAVIRNHLESRTPVVLEGDYLLPALTEAFYPSAQAVFLYEPDEAQIAANFLAREPEAGEQILRARVSYLYGQWLRREAERTGLAALPARPWDTLFERVLAVLG
jgi:2-phosphoglycerate kinase